MGATHVEVSRLDGLERNFLDPPGIQGYPVGAHPAARRGPMSEPRSQQMSETRSQHDPTIAERIARFRADTLEATGTWPAKRELAAALRELLDCVCATDASEAELLRAAEEIRARARRFASQPRMTDPAGVAEMALSGMETFHDRSPLVGLSNPMAPPLDVTPDPETGQVHGRGNFGSAYEGAPGCLHGGFIAAAFDEVLGMACIFSGHPGMTGELVTRYRRPTPIRTELRFEGRFLRTEGRKIFTEGAVYAGDVLTAEATGLFIAIGRDKFQELSDERERREAGS